MILVSYPDDVKKRFRNKTVVNALFHVGKYQNKHVQYNFKGKATRTDGATAENVNHLEFYVPKGFGPQNLIRSELRNERGSDLHLRTTAVRLV